MMYIIVTDTKGKDMTYFWHVGDRFSETVVLNTERVTEVQAGGEELECIRLTFSNLRMTVGSSVVRWRGEDARFIVNNMPLRYYRVVEKETLS